MEQKKHAILHHLSYLPEKVLSMHGEHNTTEFVLHDICQRKCFNLNKAAYLVDNPDFDCLKGIAGYSADQAFMQETIWETPELFLEHMKQAAFNQKVRSIIQPSMARAKKSEQETTQIIADYLGLQKPSYCSWPLKHDNQGILIYEVQPASEIPQEMIRNGACLLGFCPIN